MRHPPPQDNHHLMLINIGILAYGPKWGIWKEKKTLDTTFFFIVWDLALLWIFEHFLLQIQWIFILNHQMVTICQDIAPWTSDSTFSSSSIKTLHLEPQAPPSVPREGIAALTVASSPLYQLATWLLKIIPK